MTPVLIHRTDMQAFEPSFRMAFAGLIFLQEKWLYARVLRRPGEKQREKPIFLGDSLLGDWALPQAAASSPRWVPALPQRGARHRVGHRHALGLLQEGTFTPPLHASWKRCQGNVGPGAPTSPKMRCSSRGRGGSGSRRL